MGRCNREDERWGACVSTVGAVIAASVLVASVGTYLPESRPWHLLEGRLDDHRNSRPRSSARNAAVGVSSADTLADQWGSGPA